MELNRTLIVVVVSLALCFMEALSDCPNIEDKERNSIVIGSMCYHYVDSTTTRVTYDEAQADCKTRSSNLMTIADNSTQTTLVTKLTDLSDYHTILLGLKKYENAWRWITGKPLTYVNWNPKSNTSGDCAAMRLDKGGLWEPVGCGKTDWYTVYVCEYTPSGSSSGHLTTFSILMHVAISLLITLSRV
ncbi:hypothetical protein DPMN_159138 [Dreissena polymorpha]|uniref:C-type lectin domain-containing protein n=1 Tax=Dreissena polymorpha TaxID=45954 RepID=A0A9D4IMM0_DREPO|nr:hypothetical protein DPMN_159138 [Dreissena polymorpha]